MQAPDLTSQQTKDTFEKVYQKLDKLYSDASETNSGRKLPFGWGDLMIFQSAYETLVEGKTDKGLDLKSSVNIFIKVVDELYKQRYFKSLREAHELISLIYPYTLEDKEADKGKAPLSSASSSSQ